MILCEKDGETYATDVGESGDVKDRVEHHDRKDCWAHECTGNLKYAVKYTPNMEQSGRKVIEKKIRDKYDPPCGKE